MSTETSTKLSTDFSTGCSKGCQWVGFGCGGDPCGTHLIHMGRGILHPSSDTEDGNRLCGERCGRQRVKIGYVVVVGEQVYVRQERDVNVRVAHRLRHAVDVVTGCGAG